MDYEIDVKISNHRWYHGAISREEAESRLQPRKKEKNYFLLRNRGDRSNQDIGVNYSLSTKFSDRLIRHFKLSYMLNSMTPQFREGFYLDNSSSSDPNDYTYIGTPSDLERQLKVGELAFGLDAESSDATQQNMKCKPLNRENDDLNLRVPEPRATVPVVRRDESISGFLEMQKKDTFLKKKTRWFYKTGQKELIPYLADPDLADQDQEVNFIGQFLVIIVW